MNGAEDETVIFEGGTLEISTEINLNESQNVDRNPAGIRNNSLNVGVAPSVLSGVSSLSNSTASIQDENENENISGNYAPILPHYELPFGIESIQDLFTSRDGIVENAVQDCITALIFPDADGALLGSWLLTEITSWDNEKERLLLLTTKYLFTIKYDFIGLRKRGFKKTKIADIDTVIIGDLVYPEKSIVPRLNGIANGMTSVVKDCIIEKLKRERPANNVERKLFDGKYFEPKTRNLKGIKLMWNRGQDLPLTKKWNPFNEDVPFLTFTSHPLYFHRDADHSADTYSLDAFSDVLVNLLQNNNYSQACVNYSRIIIENYVGLTSILHNKSNLGFFKVRGKFAF